jgi:hypothetical protein
MLSQTDFEVSNESCSEKASIQLIGIKDRDQSVCQGVSPASAMSSSVGASRAQGESAQCCFSLKPDLKDFYPIPTQMHERVAKSGDSKRVYLGRDGPVEDGASNVQKGSNEKFGSSISQEGGACLPEHPICLNPATVADLRQQLAAALERARFAELRAERLQRCVLEAIEAPAVPFPAHVSGNSLMQSPISETLSSGAAESPSIDKIFNIF